MDSSNQSNPGEAKYGQEIQSLGLISHTGGCTERSLLVKNQGRSAVPSPWGPGTQSGSSGARKVRPELHDKICRTHPNETV